MWKILFPEIANICLFYQICCMWYKLIDFYCANISVFTWFQDEMHGHLFQKRDRLFVIDNGFTHLVLNLSFQSKFLPCLILVKLSALRSSQLDFLYSSLVTIHRTVVFCFKIYLSILNSSLPFTVTHTFFISGTVVDRYWAIKCEKCESA